MGRKGPSYIYYAACRIDNLSALFYSAGIVPKLWQQINRTCYHIGYTSELCISSKLSIYLCIRYILKIGEMSCVVTSSRKLIHMMSNYSVHKPLNCYRPLKWSSGIGLNNYSSVVDTYAIVPETVAIFFVYARLPCSPNNVYNQSSYVLLLAVQCMQLQTHAELQCISILLHENFPHHNSPPGTCEIIHIHNSSYLNIFKYTGNLHMQLRAVIRPNN